MNVPKIEYIYIYKTSEQANIGILLIDFYHIYQWWYTSSIDNHTPRLKSITYKHHSQSMHAHLL